MPLFMGITGVNEHIEPVFNAVLPSAVVMQVSLATSFNAPSTARQQFAALLRLKCNWDSWQSLLAYQHQHCRQYYFSD